MTRQFWRSPGNLLKNEDNPRTCRSWCCLSRYKLFSAEGAEDGIKGRNPWPMQEEPGNLILLI